jgi:molybdenum cofactor cytidylyltransferase
MEAPKKPKKPRSDARLSAIVLAAGLSRRMGAENKLLLPLGDTSIVRTTVGAIAARDFLEIVVVTGHEAEKVEAALAGLPVRFARNPRYEDGQMTSVRAGLAALARPCEGVMVCLADQPALCPDDLALLEREFFARAPVKVLVPTFGGARGNPIVLARESLDEILARDGNFGCRQFVAKNADVVTTVEMPNDHTVVDVDRPEDYARWAPLGAPGPR